MQIERCHDMGLIKSILMHPSVLPHIHDDGFTGDLDLTDEAHIFWMLVKNPEPAGVYMLQPHNMATYELHTSLLPTIRGALGLEAIHKVIDWFFDDLKGLKLITHVPEINKAAMQYAYRAGFALEGINRRSFLKDGVLLDQFALGITKEDWQCRH